MRAIRRGLVPCLVASAAAILPASAAAQTTLGDDAPPREAPAATNGVAGPPATEVDAARRPRRRGRFSLAPALGYSHFSQWGVPIDVFDGEIGVGVAFPAEAGAISFDVDGLVTYTRGKTQMGRDVSGAGIGGQLVLHASWLRVGFGLRLGVLDAARSTNSSSESSAAADLFLSVGVEPFSIDGTPVFLEGRVHGLTWGDDAIVYDLAAGFRWCRGGCGL